MRGIFVAVVLSVLATAVPVCAQALSQSYHLNIPREPLDGALKDLAQQTGLQIARFSEVKGSNALVGPVSGDMSVAQALTSLLNSSGLTYRMVNDRTIAVVPLESPSGSGGADSNPSQPTSSAPATGDEARKEGKNDSSGQFRLAQAASGQTAGNTSVESQQKQKGTSEIPLQEVIVTAQKRREKLTDVPQSVTVLSGDELAKGGATQFRDFANAVPGLSFTTSGAGYTQISLRGVTTGFDVGPTVGIYVDDVPYGASSAFVDAARQTLDIGLFDIDRIEVLRGPQGTLYGASTMGGLIKYVTKVPDTSRLSTDVQAGIADTSDGGVGYDAAGVVNIPVAGNAAAVRVSGFESHDGGYVDNLALGKSNVNRSDVYGGRFDFLATPTDALSIRLTGFLQNITRDGEATADYSRSTGALLYGDLDQFRKFAEPFSQRFRLASGAVIYDFGQASLTSISSYQTARESIIGDASPLYVPLFSLFGLNYSAVGVTQDSSTDKFTQEVRLSSANTQTFEWLIGGFYTHETSNRSQGLALLDLQGQPAVNNLVAASFPTRFEESAAFADLTYHFSTQFDVSGGLRYAQNKQQFEQDGSGLLGLSHPAVDSTDHVLTYLANARYHFSDRATGYMRYATGYRPGGPNFVTTDPSTGQPVGSPTFQADRLKSYEIGYKAETTNRVFGVDLATYYIDWNNIQINVTHGGFGAIANAPGGATVRGAELALSARPMSALQLTETFAYQDAKMAAADPNLGAYDGERLPNVPHFTAAMSADYEFSTGGWRPTVGTTLSHISNRTASFDNVSGTGGANPQYQLPAYTSLDVRAGVIAGLVSAQLYVHNLFNERGQLSASTSPGIDVTKVAVLQPRTIGIRLFCSFK